MDLLIFNLSVLLVIGSIYLFTKITVFIFTENCIYTNYLKLSKISLIIFYIYIYFVYFEISINFIKYIFFIIYFIILIKSYRKILIFNTILDSILLILIAVTAIFIIYLPTYDLLLLAEGRYMPGWLASDNTLPWMVLENIYIKEIIASPLFADWLMSDRPPLMSALESTFFSFFPFNYRVGNSNLNVIKYQIFGMFLNILSVYFIAVLTSKRNRILLTIILLVSPMMMVSTVYLWPKLLGAGFIAIGLIAYNEKQYDKSALSFLLAYLSHGVSIYVIIPILLLSIYKKNYSLIKELIKNSYILVPWIIFQKYIDPPGDRLLKYHLADVQALTNNSFLNEFIRSYQSINFQQWIDLKLFNLRSLFIGNNNFDILDIWNYHNLFVYNFLSYLIFLLFFNIIKRINIKISHENIFIILTSFLCCIILQFGRIESQSSNITFSIFINLFLIALLVKRLPKNGLIYLLLTQAIFTLSFIQLRPSAINFKIAVFNPYVFFFIFIIIYIYNKYFYESNNDKQN
jgi:hypothetical protein